MLTKHIMAYLACHSLLMAAIPIAGKVVEVDNQERSFLVEIVKSDDASFVKGERAAFRVSAGDLEIGYLDRVIRGNAVHYNKRWHLEQVFPVTGPGSTEAFRANAALHKATERKKRSQYVRQGDYIPEFGMIDQNGNFLLMESLRGKAFVMNFIFTRCAAPEMCPASSTRMAAMQDKARQSGMDHLDFVTITFDPAFDSPGVLRKYAEGYGMEPENFHLLTGTDELINDLLHQFGILTVEEDGTINHTMATLLVDQKGRVAYRKEGKSWTVEEFLEEAAKL